MNDRRDFFKKLGILGLTSVVTKINSQTISVENILDNLSGNSFVLPQLPYAYNALEPFIDEETMRIHHLKHHKAYVDKLNSISSTKFNFEINDQAKCNELKLSDSESIIIKNNLGGHVNHSLFWELLKPNPKADLNQPNAKLFEAIKKQFGSIESFKKQFSESATKHFGSGWCWLINEHGTLKIVTTSNQDNPYMPKEISGCHSTSILLALDVWEHAYYLKYQNKRIDYISNWWNIINWEKAESLYLNSL
jgi:Fe-Mn family superoxide dismutase